MENEELFQLAYIKVAKAAQLLQMAGEEQLAEEAEALADKVERAQAQARIMPRQVQRDGVRAAARLDAVKTMPCLILYGS
jgi:hypothetical protein